MAKRNIWTDTTSRYGTYEGERGSPEQWSQGFSYVWNNVSTIKVLNGVSPRVILGVSESASPEEIKSAYRRLVKIHHPDKGGNQAMFEKVIVAYTVLTANGDINRMVEQNYRPTRPSQSTVQPSDTVIPQLLTEIGEDEIDRFLNDDRYCAQEKKDGHHKTLELQGKRLIIRNKKGVGRECNCEESFKEDLQQTGHHHVLVDGEQIGTKFWIWDILELDNQNLRDLPYYVDKGPSRYKTLCQLDFGPSMNVLGLAIGSMGKKVLYESLIAKKKEGIVFKRLLAPYTSGKGDDQFKFKFYGEISVIVVAGRPDRASIGMELLNAAGQREFVGYCSCSLCPLPAPGNIAEIKYLYMANVGGSLYQPSFKELRDDVDINECTTAQIKYKAREED